MGRDRESSLGDQRVEVGFAKVGHGLIEQASEVGGPQVLKEQARGVADAAGEKQQRVGNVLGEPARGGQGSDDLVPEEDNDFGLRRLRWPRAEIVEGQPGAEAVEVITRLAAGRVVTHSSRIGERGVAGSG